MKTLLIVCLFLAVAFSLGYAAEARAQRGARTKTPPQPEPGAEPAIDTEALLWAIRQKETGNNPRATGRAGERTAYQFTATTWRTYTTFPFCRADRNPALAHKVAAVHLELIGARLRKRGVEPTVEHLAAAWRFGPGFALECARTEYARSVANLYHERKARK